MTTETSIYEYAKQGLSLGPDRTALWFYGKPLSFGTLFQKIDNIADNLYHYGVRQGTVVTIHLPNCPQAVMAIYAVAKLGGICNMVHPQVPWNMLQKNMDFCESTVLITGDHFADSNLVDHSIKQIYVSVADYMGTFYRLGYTFKNRNKKPSSARCFQEFEQTASNKAKIPIQSHMAEHCVFYLNSSGTTGTPKTVMHSHKACNNWVENARVFFRGNSLASETVLSVLPFFHGSGLVMNLHQVLSGGGTQVLLAKWNSQQAIQYIQKKKISIITGVPYLYQSLVKNSAKDRIFRHISQCFVSGDFTPTELKHAFDRKTGHRALFEGYGMTEIVTACFSTSVYDDRIEASGFPLVNCFAAVLDENSCLQSCGTGELVVSTNTMMMGYLKDPVATSQAIFKQDGKYWLRTGDYGRIDPDGYLFFLDRMKHIIIRNGYNVYPGEIEAVLRKLPFILDVAVLGKKSDEAKGEDICAYVVLDDTADEETYRAQILEICKACLPKYSIPNHIFALTSLPRNRMNKIDRKELEKL